MAVDPFALTSLAVVKRHLNIADANVSQDDILERLINSASAKIETYLDRKVLKREYTEYQDGRSNDRILTRQWPIEKPTELWVDSSSKFTETELQLDATDYDVEGEPPSVILLLQGTRFPRGIRNIKIVYEAGYDTIPYEIAEACIWTVEFLYDMRSDRRVGTTSKGKNQETVSFSGVLPQIVMDMLDPYRRLEFAIANIPVQNY